MAQTGGGQQTMPCIAAERVLRLSKGRRRVPVESLGPALWNRNGEPLSGKHVLSLAHQILRRDGFASYRYVAVWVHEADPENPMAVYNHASAMASQDPNLPRYPKAP